MKADSSEGGKLARRYLRERRATEAIVARTAYEWWYVLAQFVECMPADPAKTDKRHVLKWVDEHPVAPSTLRKKVSVIRGFLDWMVTERILGFNPVRRMDFKVSTEPNRIPRYLTAEEARQLWDVLPDSRARCIVALGLQMGLRRIEIARLEVHHIDWSDRSVLVLGKGSKERVVPMTEEAEHAIREYLGQWPASDGPLIRSFVHERRPLKPGTLSQMMRRYYVDAGLKRHAYDGRCMHALRHTAASDVLEECGDLTVVRDMLGHADVKTTQIYTRRTPSHQLRRAMAGRVYRPMVG